MPGLNENMINYLKQTTSPKIIAMDVDGTLVPHGGTISKYTREILALAQNNGMEIVLVTARPPRWLEPVINALKLTPVSICGNGAITVRTENWEVLNMSPIKRDIALYVLNNIKKEVSDVVFAAESVDYLMAGPGYQDLPPGVKQAEGLVPENRYESIKTVNSFELMLKSDIYKIVAETFTLEADEFLEIAKSKVGHLVEVTRSVAGRSFIEFGPIGLSKAETLEKFTFDLGYKSEDVIAFGDMPNDLNMLEWAGTGIAMGNAHADVLKIADAVAPDAADDGIAKVIDYILTSI